ncbi:MAG: BtpA/SgcQ family protein [bacterium]|nr:BtpA/SgcQ family protein [Candidatus Kapabacteria bacterium]
MNLLKRGSHFTIIGMVHLKPLPGSVGWRGSMQHVIDLALADAHALSDGGVDAIMIENFGDVPFRKDDVEAHTVAAMTHVISEIKRAVQLPLGVNVLRNDAASAIAIAAVCGAAMVRINVHVGAMLTDQGIIEGRAADTLALRRRLDVDIKILADVDVKHARPIAEFPIEDAAADAVERGLADAIIITGSRTGAGVDIERLRQARNAVAVPVLVGSGVTDETVALLRNECDGAIVGSWLKVDGDISKSVDVQRVRRLVQATR